MILFYFFCFVAGAFDYPEAIFLACGHIYTRKWRLSSFFLDIILCKTYENEGQICQFLHSMDH